MKKKELERTEPTPKMHFEAVPNKPGVFEVVEPGKIRLLKTFIHALPLGGLKTSKKRA